MIERLMGYWRYWRGYKAGCVASGAQLHGEANARYWCTLDAKEKAQSSAASDGDFYDGFVSGYLKTHLQEG